MLHSSRKKTKSNKQNIANYSIQRGSWMSVPHSKSYSVLWHCHLQSFFVYDKKLWENHWCGWVIASVIVTWCALLCSIFHLLFPLPLEIKETGGSAYFGRGLFWVSLLYKKTKRIYLKHIRSTALMKMLQEVICYTVHVQGKNMK